MGTTTTTYEDCVFNTVNFSNGNPAYTTRCDAANTVNPPPGTNSDQSSTCPDYMASCSSNYVTVIENAFSPMSPNNLVIDDEHFKNLYNVAKSIADNRNFNDPSTTPSNINVGNIVDNDDYNKLKLWADSIVGANTNITYRSRGDLIDNSSLLTMKNKYKEIASLCNTNGYISDPGLCTCNTICTCNCVTNY